MCTCMLTASEVTYVLLVARYCLEACKYELEYKIYLFSRSVCMQRPILRKTKVLKKFLPTESGSG